MTKGKKKKKVWQKKIQLFQEIEKLSQIQPPHLPNISWRMGEARLGGWTEMACMQIHKQLFVSQET